MKFTAVKTAKNGNAIKVLTGSSKWKLGTPLSARTWHRLVASFTAVNSGKNWRILNALTGLGRC